jgi:hypothetical protein
MEPWLPNNRLLAERRFSSLLRRFQADPEFEKSYRKATEKNFEEGYAVIVDEEDGWPEYYLSHHCVRKGEKTRVVFDAGAKLKGKCLNDSILSGPALQTPYRRWLSNSEKKKWPWHQMPVRCSRGNRKGPWRPLEGTRRLTHIQSESPVLSESLSGIIATTREVSATGAKFLEAVRVLRAYIFWHQFLWDKAHKFVLLDTQPRLSHNRDTMKNNRKIKCNQ